jgi:hypothetical protein
MNPNPAPDVPGRTPSERLSNALNIVLTVSKEDLVREEARLKKARARKKRAKKPA